jgi:glycosyltransferase involved in cell wall biosynthesis
MTLSILGIDAANISTGGGKTHLIELLNSIEKEVILFDRIVIWGGSRLLDSLKDEPWLIKRNPGALDRGLLRRTLWQVFELSKAARDEGVSILFIPGGSYAGSFLPVVTMSQNLLPFDAAELRRYGWSLFTLKLLLLRYVQLRSFKKSNGVIFLTQYAHDTVTKLTNKLNGVNHIIPHGVDERFKCIPRPQYGIEKYSSNNAYCLLYVSTVDLYKHQWNVVEAVAKLRSMGYPIALNLVGSAYPPALQILKARAANFEGHEDWLKYYGQIPFNDLHKLYVAADLGVFASSCENMPNILLEMMASGLPIASSDRGPMPEILVDAGVYFDPEKVDQILNALLCLIQSPMLRAQMSEKSYLYTKQYSWARCARETFNFIQEIALKYRKNN